MLIAKIIDKNIMADKKGIELSERKLRNFLRYCLIKKIWLRIDFIYIRNIYKKNIMGH